MLSGTTTPIRPAWAARSPPTSAAPTRGTPSTPARVGRVVAGDRPAPADPPRQGVRPDARDRADHRRRARAALPVPEREHRAAVRVRAAHLAEQPRLRRPSAEPRPHRRPSPPGRRPVPVPRAARAPPPSAAAHVHTGPRRGLLLPAGHPRSAVPRYRFRRCAGRFGHGRVDPPDTEAASHSHGHRGLSMRLTADPARLLLAGVRLTTGTAGLVAPGMVI